MVKEENWKINQKEIIEGSKQTIEPERVINQRYMRKVFYPNLFPRVNNVTIGACRCCMAINFRETGSDLALRLLPVRT